MYTMLPRCTLSVTFVVDMSSSVVANYSGGYRLEAAFAQRLMRSRSDHSCLSDSSLKRKAR